MNPRTPRVGDRSASRLRLFALVASAALLLPAACDTEAKERARTGTPPADTRAPESRIPDTTLGEQTKVAGKTMADWSKMKKDEFTREMDTYLTTLDRRMDTANENIRTELQQKRADLRRLQDEIRAAGENAWTASRQNLLEGVRWIENKLERP